MHKEGPLLIGNFTQYNIDYVTVCVGLQYGVFFVSFRLKQHMDDKSTGVEVGLGLYA